MPALSAADQFGDLAKRLKDAGENGLRRRLYKAISDAADPLARELKDPEHLKPYMPDRYAAVLAADLDVTVYKRAGAHPQVNVIAESYRPRNRKVIQVNEGLLRHPVFARGPDRRKWTWRDQKGKGMRPGFFDEAAAKHIRQIRDDVMAAINETARKIAKG